MDSQHQKKLTRGPARAFGFESAMGNQQMNNDGAHRARPQSQAQYHPGRRAGTVVAQPVTVAGPVPPGRLPSLVLSYRDRYYRDPGPAANQSPSPSQGQLDRE